MPWGCNGYPASRRAAMPPAEAPAARPTAPGTHRRVPPETTLARLLPQLARLGITRVADITGLDRLGLPVVTAIRPNARSLAVSQGKGLSLAAAKVAAIMEAAELCHAEQVQGPVRWARAGELAEGPRLLDPMHLPRSAADPGYDGPLAWIEGVDLQRGGPVLVPFACVSADYTEPAEALGRGLSATTGGLGAGNDRDEALVQGLCELVERDAVTLWRAGGVSVRRRTALDPASIDDPVVRDLLDRLAAAGLRCRVWDATSDVALPVLICLLVGREHDDADPELGAGCHPRRAAALLRAVLEAVQARLTFIAGSRDDMGGDLYHPARRAARRREAIRWLNEPAEPRAFAALSDHARPTAAADLATILAALARAGLREAAAVDLTRPEIGIPVLRAVVPGLEGPSDAPDYVPGRRALGLLQFAD